MTHRWSEWHASSTPLGDAVAISAFAALVLAVNSAMFAVSRLAYSLTRARQIPRIVGRLSPRFGTPWIIIGTCSLAAFGLAVPGDVEFLMSIYAFGAMFAITVAHAAVVRLRRSRCRRRWAPSPPQLRS